MAGRSVLTEFFAGYGNVRGVANVYWGGIELYRGGASSPRLALMTFAHEVLHFKPEFAQAWYDSSWGQAHGVLFLPIELRVAQIARSNWYKYADRYGEWP